MSFNQKIITVLTVLVFGITAAITFVFFEPPYTWKFWLGFSALSFSEVIFGAFWVQQISKADSVLPSSIGVWGVNAAYFVFALATTVCTGLDDKYFVLLHTIGFVVFVIAHLFFRMVEHHIEEMAKNDEPEGRISRANVTWR